MPLDEKHNLLWVSLMVPYDSVRHASGKIQNHYLKHLHKANCFNIHLLSLCKPEEVAQLDLDEYGIENTICVRQRTGFLGFLNKGFSWLSKYNPFNRYAGLTPLDISYNLKKELKSLAAKGYVPDIIIFDWTETLFLLPLAQLLFPSAKIVSIEEDVSFLGHERKAAAAKGPLKPLLSYKAKRIKQKELSFLQICDLVILNNQKDKSLLLQNGIKTNIWVWTPFFQSFLSCPRGKVERKILFYGAMAREENWKSAIWFLENVFYNIQDSTIQFWVAGNNPPKRLKDYENERVRILGFVEDISPLFQHSLCLVAPLVLGAGVKIKVLEGLSSGIPVLTNKIGIEGIAAEDGRDYFFCESPAQYLSVLNDLLNDTIDVASIEINAKRLIASRYNLEEDSEIFQKKLRMLVAEGGEYE